MPPLGTNTVRHTTDHPAAVLLIGARREGSDDAAGHMSARLGVLIGYAGEVLAVHAEPSGPGPTQHSMNPPCLRHLHPPGACTYMY